MPAFDHSDKEGNVVLDRELEEYFDPLTLTLIITDMFVRKGYGNLK